MTTNESLLKEHNKQGLTEASLGLSRRTRWIVNNYGKTFIFSTTLVCHGYNRITALQYQVKCADTGRIQLSRNKLSDEK